MMRGDGVHFDDLMEVRVHEILGGMTDLLKEIGMKKTAVRYTYEVCVGVAFFRPFRYTENGLFTTYLCRLFYKISNEPVLHGYAGS